MHIHIVAVLIITLGGLNCRSEELTLLEETDGRKTTAWKIEKAEYLKLPGWDGSGAYPFPPERAIQTLIKKHEILKRCRLWSVRLSMPIDIDSLPADCDIFVCVITFIEEQADCNIRFFTYVFLPSGELVNSKLVE